MSINLNNTTSVQVKIPPYYSDVGTLRVKKQKLTKDDNGVPRIELETEIVAPKEVEIDGNVYHLAGQELKFYLSLSDEKSDKAQQSPLAALKEFHMKMNLPLDFEEDSLPYEGLLFDFMLQTSEQNLQRRTGKNSFEPILDAATGKPRKAGWKWNSFISGVIGPSSINVDEGF